MVKVYYTTGGRGPMRLVEMDGRLAAMCTSWLMDKFRCKATITGVKIEEQEDIDKLLNLVVVKFNFIDEEGNEGEGAAFFDANAVRRRVPPSIQKLRALA